MPSKKTRSSSQARKPKPLVAIIGSGRLGAAFGIALRKAGYRVPLVTSLHAAQARRAARLIGKETEATSIKTEFGRGKTAGNRLGSVDLILIATADDAIETVAEQLTAVFAAGVTPNRGNRRRAAMHTSGALGSDVLDSLKSVGFAVGSIHPLVSISDPAHGVSWLTKAFYSLEGDAQAINLGKTIVRDLGGQSFQIRPEAKALYHAAALMASPNLTALFDIALEMLSRCGLSRTRAQAVLLPLVESTLENLKAQDPASALTGTFKRGDAATVKKHIGAMRAENLSEALDAYAVLGNRSLTLAKHPWNETEMRRLLDEVKSRP